MKKRNLLLTILGNVEVVIAGLVLVVLVLCTFLGVFARYIFNAPFNWLEEMQLAAMVWISFLMAGVCFRKGGHVAIEIIVDSLPERTQHIIEILIAVVVYFVLICFLRSSVSFTQLFIRTARKTPILAIPYKYIYGIGPVSAILMMISYTVTLVQKIHGWKHKEGQA